jgi:hypothetical protein
MLLPLLFFLWSQWKREKKREAERENTTEYVGHVDVEYGRDRHTNM